MRLSYVLRTVPDPHTLLNQESEGLHLSPEFRSLLEPLVPKTAKPLFD